MNQNLAISSSLLPLNSSPVSRDKVRLLSLNIFMRPPLIKNNKSDHKDARLRDIFTMINNYDIICLQEMFDTLSSRKMRMKVHSAKNGFLYFAESPPPALLMSRQIIDGGLLTLSKYPIVESEYKAFSAGCEIDKVAEKGMLYTKISLPSFSLHLFNTHLQSSYDKKYSLATKNSFLVRFAQLIELRNFITTSLEKHKTQPQDAVILCGDLNMDFYGAPLDSKVYKMAFPEDMGFLTGEEVLNEYQLAMLMFEHGKKLKAVDLLVAKSNLPEPKYTYADYYLDEAGKKVPCETTLTHKSDWTQAMRLDYMIRFFGTQSTDPEERVTFSKDLKEICEIDKLMIKDRPYTHLSDHYGVYLEFSQ